VCFHLLDPSRNDDEVERAELKGSFSIITKCWPSGETSELDHPESLGAIEKLPSSVVGERF
jgi:hypothetical protein